MMASHRIEEKCHIKKERAVKRGRDIASREKRYKTGRVV